MKQKTGKNKQKETRKNNKIIKNLKVRENKR